MTGLEISVIIPLLGKVSSAVLSLVTAFEKARGMARIEQSIAELSAQARQEFAQVNSKLDALSNWFVDELRCDARAMISCISDGISTSAPTLSLSLLAEAHRLATKLASLSEKTSIGSSVEIRDLIACGYWGRFMVFAVHGDGQYAKRQVFECTSKYPYAGFLLFSSAFLGEHHEMLSKVQAAMEGIVHRTEGHNCDVTISAAKGFPSSMQLPLLEIQFEEELERLRTFALNQLNTASG